MIRLIDAEIFKLRSTRTFYGLMAGALGFTLVIGLLAALLDTQTPQLADLMMIAFFPQLIALVLGILAVTSEFRHGTITPSLLVSPWRARLMLSKLGATLIVTLALGVIVALLITAIVGVAGGDTDRTGALIIGCALAIMLYGALGVGIGAILRNQVGALIGSLVYLLLLEGLIGLIPGVKKVLPEYGITGATQALTATDPSNTDILDQVPGGLLLGGFVAVFVIAGILVMQRRDVTA